MVRPKVLELEHVLVTVDLRQKIASVPELQAWICTTRCSSETSEAEGPLSLG